MPETFPDGSAFDPDEADAIQAAIDAALDDD